MDIAGSRIDYISSIHQFIKFLLKFIGQIYIKKTLKQSEVDFLSLIPLKTYFHSDVV